MDRANIDRLDELPGAERHYFAKDSAVLHSDEQEVDVFLSPTLIKRAEASLEQLVVPKRIALKVRCIMERARWRAADTYLV